MKLSIVIPLSELFDLTGHLAEETNLSVSNIFEFAKSNEVFIEIVIVNWNVKNDFSFEKELDFSTKPQNVDVKYIEISNEIHNQLPIAHKIPFYLGHAVNVGLRKVSNESVMTIKPGTFYIASEWIIITNLIEDRKLDSSFITLFSKNRLSLDFLSKSSKSSTIYNITPDELKNFICFSRTENSVVDNKNMKVYECLENRVIDYKNKRIYSNIGNIVEIFKPFDSYLFAKHIAYSLNGLPELSYYPYLFSNISMPGWFLEVLFRENALKFLPKSEYVVMGNKLSFDERLLENPKNDKELALAPKTNEIMIDRIRREKNPVFFNDEEWGLASKKLIVKAY